jgi:hypothetical protein
MLRTGNYINLDKELLDKPVYRIMPISRVLQALQEEKLILVKPKKWDDPFENALLASVFETPAGEAVTFAAKESVYGQCWTLHRETDAMWRIYSGNKDGVRIMSTPRKLLAALQESDPRLHKGSCFLGKVTYLPKAALLDRLGGVNLLSSDGSGVAESLLYKRREFAHEREVRLIYCGPDGQCDSDVYPFGIQPNDTFEKLTFDPRMDPELIAAYKLAFKDKRYIGKVTTSTLYKPPEGLVFLLQSPTLPKKTVLPAYTRAKR